jgi:hypothetical protein
MVKYTFKGSQFHLKDFINIGQFNFALIFFENGLRIINFNPLKTEIQHKKMLVIGHCETGTKIFTNFLPK